MARHVWLLVEWVDENNVFPSYGIINIDTFTYKESDLQAGKQIFIGVKSNDPRRAKIIRVSDNKRQVKEHKDFLERQDLQVKNVLQLCMRTIKEMKSDQFSCSMENMPQLNLAGQQSGLPHLIAANSEISSSDSDIDTMHPKAHQSKMNKYINQTHHQTIRYDPNGFHKIGALSPTVNQRRCSIISSTPLPGKNVPEMTKLCFDQGTQTEKAWLQPERAKIEEMELVLQHLYSRFQSLVSRVNASTNGTTEMSESEQNGEVSYVEPNDSWVAPNIVVQSTGVNYETENNIAVMGDIGAEHVIRVENESIDVKIPVKKEAQRKNSNDNTRVRRMSAQTTYSNEMVFF